MNLKISASVGARIQRCALVMTIIVAATSQANAQRVASNASIGVSRHSSGEALMVDPSKSTGASVEAGNVAVRVLSAGAGSAAGIVLGGMLGASMEGPCGCDDPGLAGAVFGALGGIVVGSSLGSASPRLGSVCTFGQRVARSLAGSVLGVVGGFAATAIVHHGIAGLFILPAFSAGGSVLALGRCEKSVGS